MSFAQVIVAYHLVWFALGVLYAVRKKPDRWDDQEPSLDDRLVGAIIYGLVGAALGFFVLMILIGLIFVAGGIDVRTAE